MLIVHQQRNTFDELSDALIRYTQRYRIRSRISKNESDESTIEIKIKSQFIDQLMQDLRDKDVVEDVSLIEYSQELSGT